LDKAVRVTNSDGVLDENVLSQQFALAFTCAGFEECCSCSSFFFGQCDAGLTNTQQTAILLTQQEQKDMLDLPWKRKCLPVTQN
jgi:hypothetical protein